MSICYKIIIIKLNAKTKDSILSLLKAWQLLSKECEKQNIIKEDNVAIDCISFDDAIRIRDNIHRLGGEVRIEPSELNRIINIQDLLFQLDQLETPAPRLIPKCPLCSSPNIHKISSTKRLAHGMTFGLLSKTARSQWECSNCGNKW